MVNRVRLALIIYFFTALAVSARGQNYACSIFAVNEVSFVITEDGRLIWFGCFREEDYKPTFDDLLESEIVQVKSNGENTVLVTDRDHVYLYRKDKPRKQLKHNNIAQVAVTFVGTCYLLDGTGDLYLLMDKDVNLEIIPELRGKNIIEIAAEESHILVLSANGKVYGKGSNFYGQLGFQVDIFRRNNKLNQFTQCALLSDLNIIHIATNSRLSYAVDDKRKVYAFGEPHDGGQIDEDTHLTGVPVPPTKIKALEGSAIIKSIVGDYHSLFLDNLGTVYSAGSNESGMLGYKGYDSRPKEIDALKGIKIVDIAAGTKHSLIVDECGNVYSFGSNGFGQLSYCDIDDSFPRKRIKNEPTKIENLRARLYMRWSNENHCYQPKCFRDRIKTLINIWYRKRNKTDIGFLPRAVLYEIFKRITH